MLVPRSFSDICVAKVVELRMEGSSDSPQSGPGSVRLGTMSQSGKEEGQLREVRLSMESFGVEKAMLNTTGKGKQDRELLERVPESRRIRVEFSGVSAWVPLLEVDGGALTKLKKSVTRQVSRARGEDLPSRNKQILSEMTGSTDPGEVLAMMGPSGSGKTTLLSLLGDRAPKNIQMKGSITFNGQSLTKAIKRRIGYVTQDDLMYETLTVFETLYFAALLRLPKTMTREEKRGRVEAVIAALGLDKCRNTIIGGAMMRGVSGGERKRVAVGHELLIDPAVIMLDEPTSGLDATAAMHLIGILRQLAEGGRSVITTIHQPSSRLYQQLNSLLLLSEGQMMYYGDAKLVMNWFENYGHPVPLGVNISDFMLDLANGDVTNNQRSGEQCRKDLVSSFLRIAEITPMGIRSEDDCKLQDDLNGQPLQSAQKKKPSVVVPKAITPSSPVDTVEKWGAGFVEQLRVLSVRTVRIRRFDSYSSQNLILFLGVAMITGLLWWQTGGKNSLLVANDTAGLLFFVLLFHQFTAMFNSLFVFPSEFKMMVKERSSGMYRLSAFYFARTFSELPLDCTIPSLLIIIMYWMTGLRPTAGAFISHWLAVLLSRLIGQSLGLLVGAAILNFKSASTVCSLVMLFMMLSGGFYIRQLPSWLDWINYTSLIYYSYNLIMKIEFRGRGFVDCGGLGSTGEKSTCTPVESLEEGLGLGVNTEESVALDVVVMVGALIFLRYALYQVLKKRTTV